MLGTARAMGRVSSYARSELKLDHLRFQQFSSSNGRLELCVAEVKAPGSFPQTLRWRRHLQQAHTKLPGACRQIQDDTRSSPTFENE